MRAAFGENERRRSRRERACDWCIDRISISEEYMHWFGFSTDHDIMASNFHVECEAAYQRESGDYRDEPSWGEMHYRGMTLYETEEAQRVREVSA